MEKMALIRQEWLYATDGLSLGAKGLLVTLIEVAAASGASEIPITVDAVAPHLTTAGQRATFSASLAELRLRRLVHQMTGDVFQVAPGLWEVDQADVLEEFVNRYA
jgi:hypothetical protein